MSELISIVIPVYNKEPYLADCFDSLRKQTYEDIEVIMVDDGSTDGSAAVCKRYVELDSRFHYIYQENGGQNSARQKGAENATGEYIIFVDADDYASHDMCRLLMDNMKKTNADLVCGAIKGFDDKGTLTINVIPEGLYTSRDIIEGYTEKRFIATLCAVLFHVTDIKNAFKHCNIRIRFGEDVLLMFYLLTKVRRVSCISEYIYFYRYVHGSASHSHSYDALDQC